MKKSLLKTTDRADAATFALNWCECFIYETNPPHRRVTNVGIKVWDGTMAGVYRGILLWYGII